MKRYIVGFATLAAVWLLPAGPSQAENAGLNKKLQAYIACINRLSNRAQESRERYLGWAGKRGPVLSEAGLGLYTIYDTSSCAKDVAAANEAEPHDSALEEAGAGYVAAVTALEPLLKTADDYYSQGDYKDDKLAKGKQMHPALVAAFATFVKADKALRTKVEELNDFLQADQLAAIEKSEGRSAKFLIFNLMQTAKALMNAESDADVRKLDAANIIAKLGPYEAAVKELEDYAAAHKEARIDSFLMSNAKTFLTSAKELMRRVRDKVPYSTGDRMIMGTGGGAWMVSGSPARANKDYNSLIETYNRLRH